MEIDSKTAIALGALASDWRAAKEQEPEITAKRRKIEEEMADLLPVPEEGSKTFDVGKEKITIRQPLKREIDWEEFDALDLSDIHKNKVMKVRRDLDLIEYNTLKMSAPSEFEKIQGVITTKPMKISFSIKD